MTQKRKQKKEAYIIENICEELKKYGPMPSIVIKYRLKTYYDIHLTTLELAWLIKTKAKDVIVSKKYEKKYGNFGCGHDNRSTLIYHLKMEELIDAGTDL